MLFRSSSSNPTLLSVPASVTVPAGASQLGVYVTLGATTTPANVVVQGTVVTTKAATVQVVPAPVDVASVTGPGNDDGRDIGECDGASNEGFPCSLVEAMSVRLAFSGEQQPSQHPSMGSVWECAR